MDYETLPDSMTTEQKKVFAQEFDAVAIPAIGVETTGNVEFPLTKYIPFEKHIDEVRKWWKKLIQRNEIPMKLNATAIQPLDLPIPNFDDFLIKNGEKCTSKTNFLGKDLSSFVVFSSFTNQFFNCRLESISIPQTVSTTNINEHLEGILSGTEEAMAMEIQSWKKSYLNRIPNSYS